MGWSQPSFSIKFSEMADEFAITTGHELWFFLFSIPNALSDLIIEPAGH